MTFIVSEHIEEKDYDRLFEISYKAYADEPVLEALSPGGLEPGAREENTKRFIKSSGFDDSNRTRAKLTDEKTGEIVSFAVMRMFDENPFKDAKDSDARFPWVEEKDRAWVEWIFNTKNDLKRDLEALQVPGAYGYLISLATHPDRQREGAASQLMKWVIEKIESKNARGLLEASSIAVKYGLYEKYGFETVDKHTYLDEERFPDKPSLTLVTMVRKSQS